jgi:hypothetical protein
MDRRHVAGVAVSGDLWDADHPYYATEGSYFANGWHADFDSWADFIEAQGDNDLDMNLLYRWDWEVPDPTLYVEGEEIPSEEYVALFFIHQRKAATRSARVQVTRDDEPAIREYLTVRASHLRLVWEPLLEVTP